MSYIPLIKRTQWIDLSKEHELIRTRLEKSLKDALLDKKQGIDPIMIKGAFGIGKTNTLYYLFHYSWCELENPAILISLDELIGYLKTKIKELSLSRIPNTELGKLIQDFIFNQIEKLKTQTWSEIELKGFPDFSSGNFQKYLEDFNQVTITKSSSGDTSSFPNRINATVIQTAVNKNGSRPLLLIDEFEAKYNEFKKIIDSSGGGVLRELYEQVNKVLVDFYLIIGNGPASGYEIERDKGGEDIESGTAENRRLNTSYALPFPTSDLLQRSFLNGDPKGYINFIWWLSRTRPGHILKLREALGPIENLRPLSFSELITKSIFKEPIDEEGEEVSYLKTQFFNEINGRIQAAFLGKVLTEFQPLEFDITDFKTDLRDCVPYFLCSSETINTGIDLIPVLREDLYVNHLKNFQKEGKFDSVNYIEHIQPYFSYILSGISDSEGNMAFGMINDKNPDEILGSTFLLPLLELTYDFISLYQDDSVKETRESLDFLLHLINLLNKSKEDGTLELCVPNIFDCFERCKLLRNDKVNLQLSLYAIRESIEQPIGSPRLKYKNQSLETLLNELQVNWEDKFANMQRIPTPPNFLPFSHRVKNNLIIIIPNLEENLLKTYLNNIICHIEYNYEKIIRSGDELISIINLAAPEVINELTTSLHSITLSKDKMRSSNFIDSAINMKKLNFYNFEALNLNFSGHQYDFLDTISKIIFINRYLTKESDINGNIEQALEIIGNRPWTEKKETIRTIEHYRKLLFDGENSTFKMINNIANAEYRAKLEETVCKPEDFNSNVWEYSYLDKLIKDESEAYDLLTTDLALLYLFENTTIEESIRQLLELCKNEYKFDVDKEDATKAVNFKNLLSILTKNKNGLEAHSLNFDLSSSFIIKLSKFADSLLDEDVIHSIDEYFSFLSSKKENGFIKSYHKTLGGYFLPELTKTLYNLNYLKTLSIEVVLIGIKKDLNELETNFSEIRVKIVTKLDELNTILDESQNLSSYAEKLNKAIKGITLIKGILDKEPNLSTLLIIQSILKNLAMVVTHSQTFFTQIEEVYNNLHDCKTKIDTYQEEIDAFYTDPLTEKLLGFKYLIKLTDNYLWKEHFLNANLKNIDEYEKLMNYLKKYANPFTNLLLYSDRIKYFRQSLVSIYNNLNPLFIEMVATMETIKGMAETTKYLQNSINQLLTPIEE
jgi:hypothetical protein